jgi:hypothetical protein
LKGKKNWNAVKKKAQGLKNSELMSLEIKLGRKYALWVNKDLGFLVLHTWPTF